MSEEPAGRVFAALADPTRRVLVRRLVEAGEASLTELARDLPISRQAVAKHLAALAEAGLVTSARAGRETRVRLTPEPLAAAEAWMTQVRGEWGSRLSALDRYAARRPRSG